MVSSADIKLKGDLYMNNFGDKIFELRREKGLTQDALAELLGVTAQAVSKWERGESLPETAMLPKIAELFDVSIDSLFGNEKKPLAEYLPEKERDFDKMVLRILVDDGDDHIKVNLPLPLVKTMLQLGVTTNKISFGNADLSGVDFEAVIKMVESGAVGRLVEVESNTEHIIIEVV